MTPQAFVLPSSAARSGLFLCKPLDDEVVERSNVLRALSKANNMAAVPTGINERDFELWLRMAPASVELRFAPLTDLITGVQARSLKLHSAYAVHVAYAIGVAYVRWLISHFSGLQVASKLGDGRTDEFASEVAAALVAGRASHVEDLVLALDAGALHAVFRHCMLEDNIRNDIITLIQDWPESMQTVRPHNRCVIEQHRRVTGCQWRHMHQWLGRFHITIAACRLASIGMPPLPNPS